MRGVTRAERTWANRLIEEFMLARTSGATGLRTWVPSLYRFMKTGSAARVQFEELAASFGYSLGLGALPVKRVQTRGIGGGAARWTAAADVRKWLRILR